MTLDPLDIMDDDGGDGTEVPLTDLLADQLNATLQAMAGPLLGKVDAYDATAGRVSITPLVPLLVDGEAQPFPKLPSVPVAFMRSTSHGYTFPIAAGAIMELVPLGHDHSKWIVSGTDGAAATPDDDRRFSLSDLVALPVAPSPTAAPPDPTTYDSAWAVLSGRHKVGDNTASDFVALASLVRAELQTIRSAYDLHVHPAGTPNTGVPTVVFGSPLPANATACTTLQAK
jgi:hypothetical protein